MKTYILNFIGTENYYKVNADNLIKAKIKLAEHEGLNPLLATDRIKNNMRYINDSLIRETL